ncbi:hypothetical protein [Streptomonospora salina]|uniref:Transposase n=1 Tax=Streptomonospora salina TaxID=104205 RepID=A0A841EI13_9ACTN|nr:hypothetical protein [Streptomonospora salina]MBB6000010.1 hypothetical protein [Streptomonospora salina]
MSRFCFIQDHAGAYGAKRLCTVLGMARSSYYAWRKSRPAREERAARDAELTARSAHRSQPLRDWARAVGSPLAQGLGHAR